MHLLSRVERFLRRSRTPATRFGREAVRDPRLVFDLRRGRQTGAKLSARVCDFLDVRERELGERPCRR